jgi:hypothetical protein
MGTTAAAKSVMKRASNPCQPLLLVLLGIIAISTSSGAIAQDRDVISYSAQGVSSDQGVQEGKITGLKERINAQRDEIPTDRLEEFLRVKRPANYTLLNPQQQGIFQNSWVTGLSDTPNRTSANILFNQQLRLADDPPARRSELIWGTGAGKSYLIPALEIPAFVLMLNAIGRLASPDDTEDGKKIYSTTLSTTWDHLVHGPWVIDNDSFGVNQLRHPYQGSVYQGLARSSGHNFWESSIYTFAGSFLWEIGGETTPPSINDQIASGIAGNFLGEPLFRMSSLLLENGKPGFWRELGAALISPPTGFNRLIFGDQFKAVFPSHDPAIFWRVRLGATRNVYTSGGNSNDFEANHATGIFSMGYGLPGKPGYSYTRPFDYFRFELTLVNSKNTVENILTHGLLLGTEYEAGDSFRGIWGLYGSYDYISPDFFRVSTTALSMGTTAQWWLSRLAALQGTALLGLGYGGGGDTSGVGQRGYHYGATGQGMLLLRLILADRAMIEGGVREYYISDVASSTPSGSEFIGRYNLGFTFRIFGPHALAVQYVLSTRDGNYEEQVVNQHQRQGTISFLYTFLSDTRFGAGE